MLRNLLLRLLCGAALAALAALCLPALSRPAAEKEGEKPLPKVSSDLALVPPDALWFVSLRVGDLAKHPSVKALKEKPEFAPIYELLTGRSGLPAEDVERLTFFARRVEGGFPLVIGRTLKPYDRDKLRKALGAGDEAKAHGKTIHASPGRWGSALWPADDRTFAFGRSSDLVPYLAALGKGGKTHPLADELKEADGKHVLAAAMLPRLFIRHAEAESHAGRWRRKDVIGKPRRDGKDRPAPGFNPDDFKEEPLKLKPFDRALEEFGDADTIAMLTSAPLLRARRALLTADLAPKEFQLKVAGRVTFTSEADAKDGADALDAGRIALREMSTISARGRKRLEAAGVDLEPFRVALKAAAVKRDGKAVDVALGVKPHPVTLGKLVSVVLFFGPVSKGRDGKGPAKDVKDGKD